jgi:hypothetical protein
LCSSLLLLLLLRLLQDGSWDEISGEAFLRKLLSMPIEEAKCNTVSHKGACSSTASSWLLNMTWFSVREAAGHQEHHQQQQQLQQQLTALAVQPAAVTQQAVAAAAADSCSLC